MDQTNLNPDQLPQAVSAFITCGDEFLLIKRQNYLKFFPGYDAFAGGKLNKNESHEEALVRELQEELDFTPSTMKYLGSLITPKHHPYRFHTHFFHVPLLEKINFKLDANEFQSIQWIDSNTFFELFDLGKILMVPPIRELIKNFQASPENFIFPTLDHQVFEQNCYHLEPFKKMSQLFVRAKTLPPADTTNCFVVDGIVIDPSPRDQEELQKLIRTLTPMKPRLIFISHHHSDHHHLAVELAEHFKLPLYFSTITYERLLKKKGADYFREISIQQINHDEKIGSWLDHTIKTISLPGHDDGMLGLYSDDLSWMFVSDLFQGFGTVVIGDDEGDMSDYLQSLDLVIKMNPRKLLPSHGITVGGIDILHRIKKHRLQREEEIQRMLGQGLNESQMLEKIYYDIPEFLKKYALKSILAHLKRIQAK